MRKPLPIRRTTHDDLLREAAELREVAQSRYSEVDLLVAAGAAAGALLPAAPPVCDWPGRAASAARSVTASLVASAFFR